MEILNKPVQFIKGVGPKISVLLNKLGIFTVSDILTYFPRTYEDRSSVKTVIELMDGETAATIVQVVLIDRDRYTASRKSVTRIVFKDDTGFLTGVWYNQKFISKNFTVGDIYLLYGKIEFYLKKPQIINPEYEKFDDTDRKSILPVYPSTNNLSQKTIRNIVSNAFEYAEGSIKDTIPEDIRGKFRLLNMKDALYNVHFPSEKHSREAAERTIKFEELLVLQLGLMLERRTYMDSAKGISFHIDEKIDKFIDGLSFKLTGAQRKTVDEILKDMEKTTPMNRLIQGDVGSGKTIVAAIAMLNAVYNGYQCVMMAPTEILALQHYESLNVLFNASGISVALLSGKITQKQKENIKYEIKSGSIQIVVGTHAVLEEDVEFSRLGLVITDEQHRFGVRQRAVIGKKGKNPDMLVMTATPIPRTMALFLYGDLDVSIIDELPPGRQKVDTFAVKPDMRKRIYDFVRKEVGKGHQCYIVCPLIEESEVLKVKSAIEIQKELAEGFLKGIKIGLLHGKMKSMDKEQVMEDFKKGLIEVLVSTTVIEVGINIPNASIMVIENADRFGLSQLHQLRGRVGRGEYKSYCILISDMKNSITRQRMKIMCEHSNGFEIAEMDMKTRGTGEFFGIRQHGLPELKLSDLFRDSHILKAANETAKFILEKGLIYNDEYFFLRDKIQDKFYNDSEIILN